TFVRWTRQLSQDPAFHVPEAELKSARRRVVGTLHLLTLMPLLAVFIARGFGLH
ncbi:DUF2214 family protein, partial [Acinetobacter baumannii]